MPLSAVRISGQEPGTRWRVDYIRPIPSGKGPKFFSLERALVPDLDLFPSLLSYCQQHSLCGLAGCLVLCHGPPHNVTSDQGIHFVGNEYADRRMPMRSPKPVVCPSTRSR